MTDFDSRTPWCYQVFCSAGATEYMIIRVQSVTRRWWKRRITRVATVMMCNSHAEELTEHPRRRRGNGS